MAAIFLGVAAALCLQPAGAAGVPRVSAALYDSLVSAQREAQAKHWPAVISRANEAAADRRKTRYDPHVINEMQGVAYANLQDWPEAARHYEATLSDGFLDPAEHQRHLRTVAECFFNAGVRRVQRTGPPPPAT